MTKKIEKALKTALLNKGKMEYSLYEYELEEHIDYWKASMLKDNDDYVFVVDENRGDVAMIVIEKSGEVHINEKARDRLQEIMVGEVYAKNMTMLIPMFAIQLKSGNLAFNGMKMVLEA